MSGYRTCDAYEKAKAADCNFRSTYHYRPAEKRCGSCRHHVMESGYLHKCTNPKAFEGVPKALQDMFVDENFVCDLWSR